MTRRLSRQIFKGSFTDTDDSYEIPIFFKSVAYYLTENDALAVTSSNSAHVYAGGIMTDYEITL